jgi:hydrogenase nickel incorporation protein HypA/HybF
MHELSICRALVQEVEQVARTRSAQRVISVVVRIGPLAGIEPKLLRSAFPLACAGTLACGAELVVEWTPVRVQCRECGARAEVAHNSLACPSCGSWRIQVVEGEELLLTRVELERAVELEGA